MRVTCKFEFGGAPRLASRGAQQLFQASTRRHVPRATCHHSTHDRYHRRSGVLVLRTPLVNKQTNTDRVCQSVSQMCVQTFSGITSKRLVRPEPGTKGQLFFIDPPEEIFVHRTSNGSVISIVCSFTTILDKNVML